MSRQLLFLISAIIVGIVVWQKVRLVIFVQLNWWQGLILFGGAVFGLFLLLDHLINGGK